MARVAVRVACWLVATVSLLSAPAAMAAGPDDIRAKVDALARPYVESGTATGLSIGMVRGGETWFMGHGEVARGTGVKPSLETLFEIGSVAKGFTGLLLADMVERGLVKLDDPVESLLPEGVSVPKKGDRVITLRDLVTHTSGLPRMPDNFEPKDPADPYADYTVEKMYAFLREHTLRREPGAQYEYSNIGMGLLGHALARKAGKSYEELLKVRICGPLGMTQTTIVVPESWMKRFAQGHNEDGEPVPYWAMPTTPGAGGIRSTAADMVKFLKANIDPAGTPLAAAIRASHSLPPGGTTGGKPMAWLKDADGVFTHTGGTGGFSTFFAFHPGRRVGVVVLCNSSAPELDALGQQILQLLMPIGGVGLRLEKTGQNGDYPTVAAIVPEGSAARGGQIGVGDQLLGIDEASGPFIDFKGKPLGEVVAAVRGPHGSVVRLAVRPKGTMDRKVVELTRTAVEPTPRKLRIPYKLDPKDFDAYVGRYQLQSGKEITYSRDGGRFYAQVSGQDRLRIYPESGTKFYYKVVDAQVTFVKDANGRVTHVIHHQGGADMKAERLKDG